MLPILIYGFQSLLNHLWFSCKVDFSGRITQQLIIRSHEGPDARAGQDDFGDMLSGHSFDHDGESGTLYTLFSAPDYT